MSHMNSDHRTSPYWECIACDDLNKFGSESEFTAHIVERHRKTISDDQIPTLLTVCSKTVPPDITSCPLCTWVEDQEATVAPDLLLDHVAEHVHSFSLRSLPWAPRKQGEIMRSFKSSVEKVETWFSGWPTEERGCEHQPILRIDHTVEKVDNYFGENEYFAESSGCSSLAPTDFTASDQDLEGMPSLTDSPGGKSGSVSVESEEVNMPTSDIDKPSQGAILVAVMGQTGTGKSSFINKATGGSLKIGHRLESCTRSYS
jgi:hypothetical protein